MNFQAIKDLRNGNCDKVSRECVCKSKHVEELISGGYAVRLGTTSVMITPRGYAFAKNPDSSELIEELEIAARGLRAVPRNEKAAIETLTGFNFNAIAEYTERAAAHLKILGEKS